MHRGKEILGRRRGEVDDVYEGIVGINIDVVSDPQYKILSSLCVPPFTVLHLLQLKLMSIPDRMADKITTLILNIPYMQCFMKIAMK